MSKDYKVEIYVWNIGIYFVDYAVSKNVLNLRPNVTFSMFLRICTSNILKIS
jgi:hypothetical protein